MLTKYQKILNKQRNHGEWSLRFFATENTDEFELLHDKIVSLGKVSPLNNPDSTLFSKFLKERNEPGYSDAYFNTSNDLIECILNQSKSKFPPINKNKINTSSPIHLQKPKFKKTKTLVHIIPEELVGFSNTGKLIKISAIHKNTQVQCPQCKKFVKSLRMNVQDEDFTAKQSQVCASCYKNNDLFLNANIDDIIFIE